MDQCLIIDVIQIFAVRRQGSGFINFIKIGNVSAGKSDGLYFLSGTVKNMKAVFVRDDQNRAIPKKRLAAVLGADGTDRILGKTGQADREIIGP